MERRNTTKLGADPFKNRERGTTVYKCISLSIVILLFEIIACAGQTNIVINTNWGKATEQSQLGIDTTDRIIYAGTNTIIKSWIKNSSTNLLSTPWWTSTQNFYFLVADKSTNFPLTPDPEKTSFISRWTRFIKPGETAVYDVPLSVSTHLRPGDYSLWAERKIVIADTTGRSYELISNPIQIQVKANSASSASATPPQNKK